MGNSCRRSDSDRHDKHKKRRRQFGLLKSRQQEFSPEVVEETQEVTLSNMKLHEKARCEVYPGSEHKRFTVPDGKVDWNVEFQEYEPIDYTAQVVLNGPPWADEDFRSSRSSPQWNDVDGKVNRRSDVRKYEIHGKVPRNPMGRTGCRGRGLLGRWGPNHAADPIVTRWKTDENNKQVIGADGKRVLEFISIQRRDNKEWAIPGGMVDAGEEVSVTLKREFGEETLNSLEASEEEKEEMRENLDKLFSNGDEIYRGYVDDPRNTDNAWMETLAKLFHDQDGNAVAKFKLHGGDDACGVQWMELSKDLKLYASHVEFLHKVALKLNARW